MRVTHTCYSAWTLRAAVYAARTTSDPDFGVGVHRREQLVDRLAAGLQLLDLTEFEEGALPRRLFTVTQEKQCSEIAFAAP